MKIIKTFLAVSALTTVTSAANATVWNLDMNASVYLPLMNVTLNLIDFTGTWDDAANFGTWTGTGTATNPENNLTVHYSQTFSMNEEAGVGTLNPLDMSSCTGNEDYACERFLNILTGTINNAAINSVSLNDYKKAVPFTPSDGWIGKWTFRTARNFVNSDGSTGTQFIVMPMNISLHSPVVPIPGSAWLFGSSILGLLSTVRRRRSA